MGHSKAEAALFSVRDSYDGTGESILAILDVVKMAKFWWSHKIHGKNTKKSFSDVFSLWESKSVAQFVPNIIVQVPENRWALVICNCSKN